VGSPGKREDGGKGEKLRHQGLTLSTNLKLWRRWGEPWPRTRREREGTKGRKGGKRRSRCKSRVESVTKEKLKWGSTITSGEISSRDTRKGCAY